MKDIRCIEIVLYEGDISSIDVKDDMLHMFLALSPGIPPTPCFFFQSYDVFGEDNELVSNAEIIEIVFKISGETEGKSITGCFSSMEDVRVHVNNGLTYEYFPWFIPENDEDNDWIYSKLIRNKEYKLRKLEQYKYEIFRSPIEVEKA